MNFKEIDQAVLDRYVLGDLSKSEALEVECSAVSDPALRERIERAREAIEDMVWHYRVTPRKSLREKVLSTMKKALHAEQESGRPPILHEGSTPKEFTPWLDVPGYVRPAEAESFHLIDLDISDDRRTGLVWLKQGYPSEIHSDVVERIMIVEGTCIVSLGDLRVPLSTGDVITIPMHVEHSVEVTGQHWCKAIVQRSAA